MRLRVRRALDAYVDHRLSSSSRAEDEASVTSAYSDAEVSDLVWEVVSSHLMEDGYVPQDQYVAKNAVEARESHDRFIRKTFSRRLRAVFSRHGLPVPEQLREAARKCCAHCGTVAPLSGSGAPASAGLTLGACSRCKAVYYCRGTDCQKKHWPTHKASCQGPSREKKTSASHVTSQTKTKTQAQPPHKT